MNQGQGANLGHNGSSSVLITQHPSSCPIKWGTNIPALERFPEWELCSLRYPSKNTKITLCQHKMLCKHEVMGEKKPFNNRKAFFWAPFLALLCEFLGKERLEVLSHIFPWESCLEFSSTFWWCFGCRSRDKKSKGIQNNWETYIGQAYGCVYLGQKAQTAKHKVWGTSYCIIWGLAQIINQPKSNSRRQSYLHKKPRRMSQRYF